MRPAQLIGFGPWGIEDVSRATGASRRALRLWHEHGHAPASASTEIRRALRYERDDILRVCIMAALREQRIGTKRAGKLCAAIVQCMDGAFYREPRPIVRFGPVSGTGPNGAR